jgi:hypothetical protein
MTESEESSHLRIESQDWETFVEQDFQIENTISLKWSEKQCSSYTVVLNDINSNQLNELRKKRNFFSNGWKGLYGQDIRLIENNDY